MTKTAAPRKRLSETEIATRILAHAERYRSVKTFAWDLVADHWKTSDVIQAMRNHDLKTMTQTLNWFRACAKASAVKRATGAVEVVIEAPAVAAAPVFDFSGLTAEELTRRMGELEDSDRPYEECEAEYEALLKARNATGWMPEWMRKPGPVLPALVEASNAAAQA